jgi:hypothetical protein
MSPQGQVNDAILHARGEGLVKDSISGNTARPSSLCKTSLIATNVLLSNERFNLRESALPAMAMTAKEGRKRFLEKSAT